MEMTNREIVYSYTHAKYPKKQIKILADLNYCMPGDIKKILTDAGVVLPEKRYKRPNSTKARKEKEEMAAEKKQTFDLPEAIARLVIKRINELDEIIKSSTKEYEELADYIVGGIHE